jgi:hypothetical protein
MLLGVLATVVLVLVLSDPNVPMAESALFWN